MIDQLCTILCASIAMTTTVVCTVCDWLAAVWDSCCCCCRFHCCCCWQWCSSCSKGSSSAQQLSQQQNANTLWTSLSNNSWQLASWSLSAAREREVKRLKGGPTKRGSTNCSWQWTTNAQALPLNLICGDKSNAAHKTAHYYIMLTK